MQLAENNGHILGADKIRILRRYWLEILGRLSFKTVTTSVLEVVEEIQDTLCCGVWEVIWNCSIKICTTAEQCRR